MQRVIVTELRVQYHYYYDGDGTAEAIKTSYNYCTRMIEYFLIKHVNHKWYKS